MELTTAPVHNNRGDRRIFRFARARELFFGLSVKTAGPLKPFRSPGPGCRATARNNTIPYTMDDDYVVFTGTPNRSVRVFLDNPSPRGETKEKMLFFNFKTRISAEATRFPASCPPEYR